MSKFQMIVIGIFVVCIIAGVAAFAMFKGGSSSTALPQITIWGTFPKDIFDQYVSKINNTLPQSISIDYVQKTTTQFSKDFIATLARGSGPDAILIPSDMILPHMDKIVPIPYSALPQRDFMDTYIEESYMYLGQQGLYALPFTVDPLIMYWNRDMFNSAGIATSPKYWDEFININKKLVTKDQKGNIRKTGLAMGEFVNVTNARELLGTLIMQLGNPITYTNNEGVTRSSLKMSFNPNPSKAVQFYTQFADASQQLYSWNRGMPESKSYFLSGLLGTYFGFASEINDIRAKNPNLNFDASAIPQVRSGGKKATFGRMYGLSIVRASKNANATFQVLSVITSASALKMLSNTLYLPSVRRDVISAGSSDPYISVFNEQALIAKSWLDIDPSSSFNIFRNMVESVTSGSKNINEALDDAGDQYDNILRISNE